MSKRTVCHGIRCYKLLIKNIQSKMDHANLLDKIRMTGNINAVKLRSQIPECVFVFVDDSSIPENLL